MLTLQHPKIDTLIASGRYGNVYTARWNNKKVAVKVVNATTKLAYKQVKQELHVFKSYNVCFLEVFACYIYDATRIGIIMELCDCDLFEYISTHGCLAEARTQLIIRDVADALSFLHSIGLFHCDIKLENLMIKKEQIYIVDFGLMNSEFSAGSFNYCPPEMWLGTKPGPSSDVWALAICIYACLTLCFPFQFANENDKNYCAISKSSCEGHISAQAIFNHYGNLCTFSCECKCLLDDMLTIDKDDRITMKNVGASLWLNIAKKA